MSYQVIARKWRPQAFDEVTGQDHITRTLRNGIEHGRLHHAYVFSGARGVGKTTTARLLAKALNCHKTPGPNPEPCHFGDTDICPSCLEISESRSMDVIEFDAASNTGVQDIRDIILENINVAAARDRYKIFIIDEVHMLSNSSFNALLKTVEEPPQNVVFVMATTELHKVPDTITSRSQEFIFRTIPQTQIFERLRLIADAEKIDIDDAALQMLARSGEGSMRDAQSNFDQVISFSDKGITSDEVTKALGLASSEVIEKIVGILASGESEVALAVVADLVDRGQDLRTFCRDILAVIRDLLMFKVSGGESSLIETSVLSNQALKENSDRFSEADLIRFFNALAETETQLKDAIQSRYVLEIGLVKLVEMRRLQGIEQILNRLVELERSIGVTGPRNSQTISDTTIPEKKTLEPGLEDEALGLDLPSGETKHSDDVGDEIVDPNLGTGYVDLEEPTAEFLDSSSKIPVTTPALSDLSFVASLPVKLPPIDSEYLEHFEDKRLDAQFEQKLGFLDEVGQIADASKLVFRVLGERIEYAKPVAGIEGSAAAPARAPLHIQIPDFATDEIGEEMPRPAENASEEELIAFVNSVRTIKVLKRVFRARVTSVRKSEPAS